MTRPAMALVLGWFAAGSAAAEPAPEVAGLMPYMDGIRGCLAVAETPDAAAHCIGPGTSACIEGEPNGLSTHGMMFCTFAEMEAWDILLNEEYQRAMASARRLDAIEAETFPEFAVRADRLREAQRAWIAFRDAECALAYAEGGSGSIRLLFGSGCQMQMTAERTIDLRFLMREEAQ